MEAQEEEQQRRSRRARSEHLWKVEPQRSGSVTLLHRGGCGLFDDAGALIDREAALAALREPDVETCTVWGWLIHPADRRAVARDMLPPPS
ncbi:DUF6233 domain-containing protein [Streptomyces sp. NPDC006261]|uniref:DUF6233 domain-containing protein n=1 Tax=Streptomyces sp. NPDC006261 TaxID=3156739 RepID=UPI0033A55DE7